MKKLLYILIIIFALPQLSNAQNDYNNQWDLDIHFLALEGTYKARVANKLFVGVALGVGFFILMNTESGFLETIRPKTFITYNLSNKIQIYGGVSYSIFSMGVGFTAGQSLSINTGIFYKVAKIELGIEPSIVWFKEDGSKNYQSGKLTTSLLIIKIPLSRW